MVARFPTLNIVDPSWSPITPNYDIGWKDTALDLIEECGRVSHRSEDRVREGTAEKFIRGVAIRRGHESILRHSNFTALIIGSRAMSHQLVRHSVGITFTQESMRYCDYSREGKKLSVVIPPSISVNADLRLSFLLECGRQYDTYCQFIGKYSDTVVAPEDARYLLPHATATTVYATANYQAWRHFIHMRNDAHAQWEIREIAKQAYEFFKENVPVLMEGLKDFSGNDL
ncbi:MAG: FAD-dependent thymidylate synthase [Candidatus Paceibacterota bacterium]|jgi:thymidylate synthase (FAD)